jgi:hypothetical protein
MFFTSIPSSEDAGRGLGAVDQVGSLIAGLFELDEIMG